MNLPQGAMDDIWNHSQFDEHYELIQSGGYENLFQTAGATSPTGPATTTTVVTGPAAPSNFNAWPYVIAAMVVSIIIAIIIYLLSKAKSDARY